MIGMSSEHGGENVKGTMEYRQLGASGLNASVVGLGTFAIGGWFYGGAEEKDSIAAIHASIDHGVNLIDTAPIYGYGYAEEVVGKAIAGRRDKVLVATKMGLVWEGTRRGVLHACGRPVAHGADPRNTRCTRTSSRTRSSGKSSSA